MPRSLSLILLAVTPGTALAHGFAQRYDLPVPLNLYLGGAAATVAFSFLAIAAFLRRGRGVRRYPRWDLLDNPLGGFLASGAMIQPLRAISLGLLALVVTAGYFGDENPFKNIAPTTVWVIWWVGLAYVSGLLGNIWLAINPWSAVFAWAEKLTGRPWRGLLTYPGWLGQWPAVALFAWFVWAELIWPNSDHPADLARVALTYSTITWLGMLLFGRLTWLRNGESFTLVFGILARFSCSEIRVTRPAHCPACGTPQCQDEYAGCVDCLECFERAPMPDRQWNLRPWAVGLLTAKAMPAATTVFILLMLSSVTFDGLLSTPLWAGIAEWMLYSGWLRPLIVTLQDLTGDALSAIGTIALVVFLIAFQLLYLGFAALMWLSTPSAARRGTGIGRLAGCFVLTLVPIALAYHLAHYLPYLAIAGQYIIPLSSDPFGYGWDLFGTSLYFVDVSVINARFVWLTSVIAIVAGHVVAVWLGHVMALRVFRSGRAALLSQFPMLLLMVAYTMLSLWILAQPVVDAA